MWPKLKSFFLPPYVDQQGTVQRAEVFRSTALLLILGTVFSALLMGSITGSVEWILGSAIFGLVLVISLVLMMRGHLRLSIMVLLVGAWAVITMANYSWGGPISPALPAYVMLLIFAAMMAGRRALLGFAALSILTVLGLHLASEAGMLPTPTQNAAPEAYTVHALVYIVFASLLLWVSSAVMRRMLQHVGSSKDTLQTALHNLRESSHSQRYLDNVLRSMSNLLIVLDRDYRITTVNHAAAALLGYTEEELIGMRFEDVCELHDKALMKPVDTDEITRNSDYTMINRDGHKVPVSLTISLMQGEKSTQGMVIVGQDLTQVKATEQERLRNAMRYRALFEQSNDGIFIVGINGDTIAVNRRAAEMLGYTVEELTTMPWREFIAPREREDFDAKFRQLLDGARLPLYERMMLCSSGREIAVEANVELVRDSNGQPLHIQSVMRDITGRKQAENQLAYQARLLDIVSDAIISTDMDNVIISWNRAAEKVYGWTANEVIGKKLTDVVPTIFAEGGEDFIKEQYFKRGYWQSELIQKRRDGRQLVVLSSVSLIRDNKTNKINGVVAVNHDITQRKMIEDQLELRVIQFNALRQVDIELTSTLNVEAVTQIALNAAYVLSSADAGYIMLNDAGESRVVETIGGYEGVIERGLIKPEGIIGRVYKTLEGELITNLQDDRDYIPHLPDSRAKIVIPLISQDRFMGLLNLETSSPEQFTHETFEYLNLLTARVAVALDNARLYEMSQQQVTELQTLFQRVSSIEQLKTDMIRIASHDLRNPIGIFKGYLGLSQEDIVPMLPEHLQVYFSGMEEALARMETITEQILSLDRIEQIAKNDIHEPVDVRQMVRRVLYENERAVRAKHIRMEPVLPHDALVIMADPAQLHEAVFNLVENAVKYTPEGGLVQVELSEDNGEVVFKVVDTGYGIPEDQQKKLFEPGFRAESEETEHITGTGWGLYLVKGIVERHGGEMIFHSEYRKGSTFGFRLPPEPMLGRRRSRHRVGYNGADALFGM